MAQDSQNNPVNRYGYELYRSNPTIPSAGQIAKTRRAKLGNDRKGIVIDNDTGDVLGHGGAMVYEFEEVDKERFVKLYLAGLKQAIGMTKPGLLMFQMVYDQMRNHKDRDFVILSALDAPEGGERSFQRGIKELLDKKFLFRSTARDQYWVNVQYMFNGDRLAFVKAYKLRDDNPQQGTLFDAAAEAESVADELESTK
jgi:hypothetical protein